MPRLVMDFAEQRPILRPPNWVRERITAALPTGWELVQVEAPADGTGDGAHATPEAIAAVADAEIYLGFGVPREILTGGPGLRWVHSGTAGVGSSLTPELHESDVVFTNSAGIHAVPMAETVIGMMLHFARGLDLALRAQREGRWDTAPFDAAESPVHEVGQSTVGIVGYGGIGREVARRAHALGARVLALKRRPSGEDEYAEIVRGEDALQRLLEVSDYLVLTAPETDETRGMISAQAISWLPTGSVLINVARGGLVDETALIEALQSGRLRGAGLDVFTTEPLPQGHPLWRLPNVLITPHVSSYTHHFWERETDLVVENLRRYFAREPLINVVDKRAGY